MSRGPTTKEYLEKTHIKVHAVCKKQNAASFIELLNSL